MKCNNCGRELMPLFTSFYCPKGCSTNDATPHPGTIIYSKKGNLKLTDINKTNVMFVYDKNGVVCSDGKCIYESRPYKFDYKIVDEVKELIVDKRWWKITIPDINHEHYVPIEIKREYIKFGQWKFTKRQFNEIIKFWRIGYERKN